MMRSLFSGVSGLKSHQTRMDVIGNNVANVNTTGYKSSRTTFADTLSQTMTGASAPSGNLGGTNPKQVGLGTGVASIDTLFTDGSVQSTGKNTDLCLSGNGLFVVSQGVQKFYTRDGAFEFDAEGNYVLPSSGLFVQGWTATDGVLNTSGAAGNITIPSGKSMAAKATTKATYSNNLNSSAATIDGISLTDSLGNTVKVASGDTSSYGVGDSISSAISNEAITFSNGGKISSANGKYVRGTNYPVSGVVTLSNGDTISVPSTSTATYKTGSLPTPTVTAIAGSTVTLSDGSTLTNTSGKTYAINDPITLNVASITATVTSADSTTDTYTPSSLTASSGANVSGITLTVGSGTEVAVGSSDTNSYKKGGTYTSTVKSLLLTMSDATTVNETSGKYSMGATLPVTTTLTVYDTLGNKHSIPVYFTKTTTDSTNGNAWTVSVATDGSGKNTITESDGSTTTVKMADSTLQFDTAGKYNSGSGTATLTLTNGSTGTQTVTINLSSLTQYSGTSTVNGATDGNAAGTLSSVSIDTSGTVTGTYTNGVKQTEAQVAIAQFNNAAGLTKTGNSLYQESNNSGTANIKTASDLGVKITPSALEMSNVDIANEFSDMIITQRGFQSNSKIITVGDEMLETLIGMKR